MLINVSVKGVVIQLNLIDDNSLLKTPQYYKTNKKPSYFISSTLVDTLEEKDIEPSFKLSNQKIYDQGDCRWIDGYTPLGLSYRIHIHKHIKHYDIEILKHKDIESFTVEYYLTEQIITDILCEHHFYLMHGSAIDDHGHAIIISGYSRAGKTTLAKAWIKEHPKALMINDDKPMMEIKNQKIWVSGHPWAGSEGIQKAISRPLLAVVFIKKSDVNQVVELSNQDKIALIMEHMKRNLELSFMEDIIKIITKMIETCIVIEYQSCNDQHSVTTLVSYLATK